MAIEHLILKLDTQLSFAAVRFIGHNKCFYLEREDDKDVLLNLVSYLSYLIHFLLYLSFTGHRKRTLEHTQYSLK